MEWGLCNTPPHHRHYNANLSNQKLPIQTTISAPMRFDLTRFNVQMYFIKIVSFLRLSSMKVCWETGHILNRRRLRTHINDKKGSVYWIICRPLSIFAPYESLNIWLVSLLILLDIWKTDKRESHCTVVTCRNTKCNLGLNSF